MNETPRIAAERLSLAKRGQGYEHEALHTYTGANGAPLYWRIRYRHPESDEKWIRPMRKNGDTFELGEPSFPNGKPLYRLYDLQLRPDETVYLVEGEWCADHMHKLGLLATTSGGAGSVASADWHPLAGRQVVIWPDNDDAGAEFALAAVDQLTKEGCDVRWIDVGALDLPDKGDVVDWLQLHPDATAADIAELDTHATPPTLDSAIGDPIDPDEISRTDEGETQTIVRLADLSRINYEKVREKEAKTMGIRVGALDKEVYAARQQSNDTNPMLHDIEPWPEPVDPCQLLLDIVEAVNRHIICPGETATTVALWVAMTWYMDVIEVAPLVVITAPEKRCGKSQLLSLMGKLVKRPLIASNITPAAMFRSIDAWQPTLMVDEADTFVRDNEELRGIINSGHTRDSAYVIRVVGDDYTPRQFSVWGAKALAGIGNLPDTLMDRSIPLVLRRKLPHERVERLRHADLNRFPRLAAQLARFAIDNREAVRAARPKLPEQLNDRAQDNWEPLMAIAEAAGGPLAATSPRCGHRALSER